jgi:hypothetical protein
MMTTAAGFVILERSQQSLWKAIDAFVGANPEQEL